MRLKRWAVVLVSTMLALCVAEGWLRVEHARARGKLQVKYAKRDLCTKPDANKSLVYSLVANRCGANSQSYHDSERTLEKPPGTVRIVVIGDSVADGAGVAREARFASLLDRSLNRAVSQPVEVIVLARTGYSTSQELFILEHEAALYQPDLIIWSYVLNDPAHPVFDNANGELGLYYFKPAVHLAHLAARVGYRWKERRRRGQCPEEYHARLHCVHRDEVEASVGRIGAFGRDWNIPVVFVIHPVFERGRDFSSYSLSAVHERLALLASSQGLVVVDLLGEYREHDPEELKQHPEGWFDPWHPNEKGHAVVAAALHHAVVSLGLLPQRAERCRERRLRAGAS